MAKFGLKLTGDFLLFSVSGDVIPVPSQKGRALLALLATSTDGRRSRKLVREMLWERGSRSEQISNLAKELSRLRLSLKAGGADGLIGADREWIWLELGMLEPNGAVEGAFLEGIDLPGCRRWEAWLEDQRVGFRTAQGGQETAREIDVAFGAPVPSARNMLGATRLTRSPKPSVAVLPFATGPADDPGLGFALADGLAMRLACFPQLFVAGSASAAMMVQMGLLRHEIAERLGVRYTIEGLILTRGDRLRISVAVVDSDSGEQTWGEVFTEAPDGSGAFEQRIVDQIAPQLWSAIDTSERRAGLQPMGIGSDRYQRWWRASALFRSFRPEDVAEALGLARELAAEDPGCPFCASLAAFLIGLSNLMGLGSGFAAARQEAGPLCAQALRHGADNVEVLGYCAGAELMVGGDLDVADGWIGRALALLPAYQPSLFWGGWIDLASGRPGRARERFELALRINPATGVRGPTLCGIGYALLFEEDAAGALEIFRAAVESDPGFPLGYPGLLAAASRAGEAADAEQARARLDSAGSLRFIELVRAPGHRAALQQLMAKTSGT